MDTRPLTIAVASVLALAAAPAPAQERAVTDAPASSVALAASVGRWLYDDRGEIAGSVKSLSPDGRTAVVVLGVYFHTSTRLVEVPVGALRVVDGRTTLRAETLQALLNAPARGG